MASRHCPAPDCNAIETAEHPLKTCPACERVAYCGVPCQEAHWVIHKPVCHAAVMKDNEPDDYEDSDEDEEENEENSGGFLNENDDLILDGVIHPAGTYIEGFMMPTEDHPEGLSKVCTFDKTMVMCFSAASNEESELFKRQIVEGSKAGLDAMDVFNQIAKQTEIDIGACTKHASDPHAYGDALQILADRYHAAKPQGVDNTLQDHGRFVSVNEQGDVVMMDDNDEAVVVPADWMQVLELEGDEKDPDMIFFDSAAIANMKYLRPDEKETYKAMLARKAFEQKFPGKTMAEIAVERKKLRADAQATIGDAAAKEDSIGDDLAPIELSQK